MTTQSAGLVLPELPEPLRDIYVFLGEGTVQRSTRAFSAGRYFSADDMHAYARAAIAALAAPAADGWRPIETAPEGEVVLVGWRDERDDFAEHHTMDVLDEGVWHDHEEHVQWAEAVAPPGSVLPPQTAPYRWWRAVPPLPAAPHAQGEGNGDGR